MNASITISTDGYFYNAKREAFLQRTHKALLDFKYSAFGRQLTPEAEALRKAKSLKAAGLANRIKSERKAQMKADGLLAMIDGVTKLANPNL